MEQFLNDITVWAAAYDWLRIVLTFLLMVGVPLFVAIVMLFGSEKLIATLRKAYPQIRPSFDQSTDPLVLAIAARTNLTAEQVVKLLTSPDGLLLTANKILMLDRSPLTAKMTAVKAVRGPVTGSGPGEAVR